MTWREALETAFSDVDAAYERRRQVVVMAHDAGLSFRAIAEVVGMTAAGVHRIVGKSPSSAQSAASILDSDAEGVSKSKPFLEGDALTAALRREESSDAA